MAVDRQQAYINSYQREARNALQRFTDGERDDLFLLCAFELIRTYLQIPRHSTNPLIADLDIVRLAQALQIHLSNCGFWRQLLSVWPQLIGLAEQLSNPVIHAELVKHFATIKDHQGDGEEANLLYRNLVRSSHFPQLPVEIQADILQQAGTTLVWRGKLAQASSLLGQVLALVARHPIDRLQHNQRDRYGVRSNLDITPLWESKAYSLNQMGNIAMFQGKFVQAEQLYTTCLQTLNEHGEVENLACVAHQALGRLWLHWRQPEKAIPVLEKGIAIRRRRHEQTGVAINSLYLAAALLQCRELDRAERLLTEALPILRATGNQRDSALCHLYFGQLELLHGRRVAGIDQWRQALAHFQTVHTPLVEQRIFIQYSPWLLSIGEVTMFRAVTQQLYNSLRQQELGAVEFGRLRLRFGFK